MVEYKLLSSLLYSLTFTEQLHPWKSEWTIYIYKKYFIEYAFPVMHLYEKNANGHKKFKIHCAVST